MGRRRMNTNGAFRTIDQLVASGSIKRSGIALRTATLEFVEKMSLLRATSDDLHWLRCEGKPLKDGWYLLDVESCDMWDEAAWLVTVDGHIYYHTEEHLSLNASQRYWMRDYCGNKCSDGFGVRCADCALGDAYYYDNVRVDTWEALKSAAVRLSTGYQEGLSEQSLFDLLLRNMSQLLEEAARAYHSRNNLLDAEESKKTA